MSVSATLRFGLRALNPAPVHSCVSRPPAQSLCGYSPILETPGVVINPRTHCQTNDVIPT